MVPQNWQEFLGLDNKKELFLFLSEQVVKMAIEGRQIIVTKGDDALQFGQTQLPQTSRSFKLFRISRVESSQKP